MCLCETILPVPQCQPFYSWQCYPITDLAVPDLSEPADLSQPVDAGTD